MEFELLYKQLVMAEEKPFTMSSLLFKAVSQSTQWITDAFNELPPVEEWYSGPQLDHHPLLSYYDELIQNPP